MRESMKDFQEILRQHKEGLQKYLGPPPDFEEVYSASDFTCDCGGAFNRVNYVWKPRLPHHRKRRIQKKWLKRWRAKNQAMMLVVPLMRLQFSYRCSVCGTRQGGYSFLGRQIFKVEPLPQGAMPVYDRDPEAGV